MHIAADFGGLRLIQSIHRHDAFVSREPAKNVASHNTMLSTLNVRSRLQSEVTSEASSLRRSFDSEHCRSAPLTNKSATRMSFIQNTGDVRKFSRSASDNATPVINSNTMPMSTAR